MCFSYECKRATDDFYANPDPFFHSDADLDPDLRLPINVLRIFEKRTLHRFILSLHASIYESTALHPWLHFELFQLLNCNFDADPDPAFQSDVNPELTFQNYVDPCGYGFAELICRIRTLRRRRE
jgi:hypothetical protein